MSKNQMRIATFNVNSIRVRMGIVTDWMKKHRPDVMCFQETKVVDEDFPLEPFEALGYHVAYRGQKSYNGVAIATRVKPTAVTYGLDVGEPLDESRFMTVRAGGVTVVNTYVPQGHDPESEKYVYKKKWLERLETWFGQRIKPRVKIAWCGDINIAPEPMDVHAPKRLEGHVCFNPEMTAAMNRIRDIGLVDVFRKHQPEGGQFSYFDYRGRGNVEGGRGWRVDHIHATKALANKSTGAWIDVKPRLLERPSDHTPLVVDFAF